MPSCPLARRLLGGSLLFLVLSLYAAPAQPPATPTDAEVRARIQRLEQKKDEPARLEALQWLQKHAAAKDARLAIPILERTIRDDPVSDVRKEAVLALFEVAKKQKLPCPLGLVQAILDEDVYVRQDAGLLATHFTAFAPGTVELALRGAWSEDADVRSDGLNLLARAAPRDPRALAVLETAQNDRSFQVRHNSHCSKFVADDRLDEFLAWLVRLQEDKSVLDPVPKDETLRKREELTRNLSILGSAQLILEWCEKRPDDLAAALVKLLGHKSPVVRRGAVRLIGVTAANPGPSKPQVGDYAVKWTSYLFPDSNSRAPKPDSQPQPRLEMSKVAPCLEKRKARERLEMLRANDPDRAVRAAARSALDRLARLQVKP